MPQTPPTIRHPANYDPYTALATGADGEQAIPVSAESPLPCSEKPLGTARALVFDTAVEPGLVLMVDCSVGGKIVVELADQTLLPLSFAPGVTMLPLAVNAIRSSGTNATFNAWVLD